LLSFRFQARNYTTFRFGKRYPCINDRFQPSGIASGHYFHQDLFVANKIFLNNPERHVDIGSRVDGFVAHVASFRNIEVIDVRPLSSNILNVKFICDDLMNPTSELHHYSDSVSCLHAIEHFGLGRYGDKLDYFGYLKGLDTIYHILKPGGKFYVSVPIGDQRIEFNAHRIFSIKYLLYLLTEKYILDSFSYVDDAGDFHNGALFDKGSIDKNFGCSYGCGIFELTKR
jgi:hypothetical protein